MDKHIRKEDWILISNVNIRITNVLPSIEFGDSIEEIRTTTINFLEFLKNIVSKGTFLHQSIISVTEIVTLKMHIQEVKKTKDLKVIKSIFYKKYEWWSLFYKNAEKMYLESLSNGKK